MHTIKAGNISTIDLPPFQAVFELISVLGVRRLSKDVEVFMSYLVEIVTVTTPPFPCGFCFML